MKTLSKILSILKIPGIVVGCVGSLYLIFTFFDGIKDDISDIKETQVEYGSKADTIMRIAEAYDERIRNNEASAKSNEGQIRVLRNSYLEYLKHDSLLTKDEFVEYMNPFLEYIKKNSSPTVLREQTPSPAFPFTTKSTGMNTGGHTREKWNSSQ